MRKLAISIGTAAGVLLATQVAQAHLLECEKTVNGTSYVEISSYPTTLNYEFTISNADTAETSDVLSAEDSALASYGFSFDPAPPFSLMVGESVTDMFDLMLEDEEACLELAATDGVADNRFDNVFVVTYDTGQAMCFASVVCLPAPPPDGEATRTPGFFKTHESALTQCLDEGAIDLGIVTIDSLAEALGLLWGSPAVYSDGEKRSDIDQARFLLARHALVATCNERLFDNQTDPADLIEDAIDAITGTDCELMHELQGMLDDFNNSGDDEDFPEGFEPGPATPQHAASIADDPTTESGDMCSP